MSPWPKTASGHHTSDKVHDGHPDRTCQPCVPTDVGFDLKALQSFRAGDKSQEPKVAPGTQLYPRAADTAKALAVALRYEPIQACSESSGNNGMFRPCHSTLLPWKRRS